MAYAVTAGYKTIAKSKAVFWKSKIHIVEDDVDISGNDYLQKWTLKNYTYDENDGTLIGNTIAKMLELQLINTSDYVLENKEIELYSGVVLNPTADESIWNIEYVPHGNFIIQPVENREVPAQQRFVAYDYMVKFNKQFSVGALTYPTTPLLLLQHICTLAGVTLATTSFTNDDFVITAGDAFVNYTCREVLSSICKVSGTTASINRDNELELLNFGATSVETIDGNHYITFEKNKIWGELNELTLNSYDIDGENVTENDATSISTYGLTPLNIQEQLIMYTQDLRTTAITDLWTKLFQIKYTPFKMKVKSFNYLDPLDKITIKDVNDNSYTTYVFNQTIIFDMGSMSNEINTPALTLSQVQLKFIPTEKLVNQRTEIIVNKHEGEITLLASSVENIELQRPFYRYSANADGSSMTESPQVSTRYLGTYVGTTASANYTDYTWTLIKGADGQDGADGLPGTPGADGTTYYTWIRYSDYADGTDLYATPTENTLYIGIAYNKTSATPSSTKTDYTWSKFKGDTGTAGENGTDGATLYTWIKYADDSLGTNLSDTPTGKTYIGLAHNKTTATESTTPSDYTWALIKGSDGIDGNDGVGITSATVTYQLHTNGTTAPTGSWLSSPPTPVQGKYLWVRTVTTYSDSSSSTTYAVSYYATDGQTGEAGTDGTGIASTEVKYQIGTSGTVAPTGTWLDNVPTAEQGKYLWTRTIITYTDNSTSTAYSTSYYATDGERGSVIWTTTVAPATPNYTFTISDLVGGDTPRVGDIILYSYYKYTVVTVGATTLLAGTRVSIRGATGATGTGAKWYTGTAITGTSTTATIFSGSGITAAIVGDMYLNTSTNNTYRCTLAGNAATAKWVFEVNIKGLDGDDGKSLWLAYCDEIDTYTGFSVDPEDSNKDYYGMYVGLTQSNTATDYEWYPSNYKLDGDISTLDNHVRTTVEGSISIVDEKITTQSQRIDNLEDFVETVSTTGNYVKLTGTPVSNGAVSNLSIKGFDLMGLYPGLSFPGQYTFPGALSFYTLVFDSVSTFNATPKYVYINSPIPLQKTTTWQGYTYDEISITGNQVSIIQRIGYSGTTPTVLSTPIVHDVGSVLLPTFDGDTYIKVLGFGPLIFNSTYMQKNALTNVFATQLESSAVLSITTDRINSKVSKDGVISEINQSPEQIAISASKIALEGYTTINDGFSVDLDGNASMNNATINGSTLKLADNTEIVGGNGILTNVQYISLTNQLGLINNYSSGSSLRKGVIDIEAYIPANFTIKSAFLTLRAYKTRNFYTLPETFNSTDEYGKITNIRVYKATTNYEYIYSDYGFWGVDTDNPPTLTEITNALATGGYTNPTTAEVSITSIDISSYLSTGQNTLWIQTADSVPSPYNDANVTIASQKTQSAVVILNVIGYTK